MTEMMIESDNENKRKTPELLFHVDITDEMQEKIYAQVKEKNLLVRKKERIVKKPYSHTEEIMKSIKLKRLKMK